MTAGIELASVPADADVTSKKSIWSNLGFQVFVAMVLGAIVGFMFPAFAAQLKIFGDIFLRLVRDRGCAAGFPDGHARRDFSGGPQARRQRSASSR
jgi:hypothetical protein